MTNRPLRPFVFRWTDSIEHDDSISSTARHCALALAREMDIDGLNCYPSKATLAERMRCSERTVARALNELRASGWLDWRQRPQRGTARLNSNVYRPIIPEGMETDSRSMDNLSRKLSENSTGEDVLQSSTFSDITEDGALVVDATCVFIRDMFGLSASHTDGYLKYADAVESVHSRHGREGLLRLCDLLLEQSPETLSNAISPLRVLAHRINEINAQLPLIDPTLPYD